MIISRLFQVGVYLAVGVLTQRLGLLADTTLAELSSLVFKVMFPAVIFSSVVTAARTLTLPGLLTPVIAFVLGVLTLLAIVVHQKARGERPDPSFAAVGTFGNTAFLGIPLCAALFGPEGGATATLFDFGAAVTLWTIGAHLMARYGAGNAETPEGRSPGGFVKNLVNPNTIALVLGLSLGRMPLVIPGWVMAPIQGLGATALPLAMLVVGATIASANPFAGRHAIPGLARKLTVSGFTKLLVAPALAYVITTALGLTGSLRAVIILQAAMPTMASTPVYLKYFDGDENLAAAAVLVTTVACLISLPLVSLALSRG